MKSVTFTIGRLRMTLARAAFLGYRGTGRDITTEVEAEQELFQ